MSICMYIYMYAEHLQSNNYWTTTKNYNILDIPTSTVYLVMICNHWNHWLQGGDGNRPGLSVLSGTQLGQVWCRVTQKNGEKAITTGFQHGWSFLQGMLRIMKLSNWIFTGNALGHTVVCPLKLPFIKGKMMIHEDIGFTTIFGDPETIQNA